MMKTALTFGLLFGASTSLSTLAATVLYDFETDAEQKAVPRLDGKDFQVGVTTPTPRRANTRSDSSAVPGRKA